MPRYEFIKRVSTGNGGLKRRTHGKEPDDKELGEKNGSRYKRPYKKDTSKEEWKEERNSERIRFEDGNSGLWRNKGRLKITVRNENDESRNRLEEAKGSTSKIGRDYREDPKERVLRFKNYQRRPSTSEDEEEYRF